MSNLCAFNSVVHRAEQAEATREGLNDSIYIQVPASVITFADLHIRMLEEQLAKLQKFRDSAKKELVELRSIASVANVNHTNQKIDTGHHHKAFSHVES